MCVLIGPVSRICKLAGEELSSVSRAVWFIIQSALCQGKYFSCQNSGGSRISSRGTSTSKAGAQTTDAARFRKICMAKNNNRDL